jgi:hypothetical protein
MHYVRPLLMLNIENFHFLVNTSIQKNDPSVVR